MFILSVWVHLLPDTATELSGLKKMDPAEIERMGQALTNQGTLVGQHDTTLREVLEHIRDLATNVNQLPPRSHHLQPRQRRVHPAPLHPRHGSLTFPARYPGDLGTCAQFLNQCSLVFNQQPSTYSMSQSKVAFVMSLLSGQAAAWALAVSNQRPDLSTDYKRFSDEMKRVFDHPVKGREAEGQILNLRRGGSQSPSML